MAGSVISMLSTHVANKIAAGEVVERPAAAVKELLENSVDAGATRIEISITAGGRKLISVSDNGCGMNRDDAMMAPERQATSKIREVEDIERVSTLGFRGEALASIASVSRFRLRTRQRDSDVGTEVEISGGKLINVSDCGCPPGTEIEVRDLFFNVPVRRKFLRSFQTEQAHIKNVVYVHAAAYPGIGITLKCDGEETYRFPAADRLTDRLTELAGEEEMGHMIPFEGTSGSVRVYGYAGIPSWTRPDRTGQYIFVNGRPASAPSIYSAIRDAYPKMGDGRRAQFYLYIELPPDGVDVNVHPTKREVRFRNNIEVRAAVINAVSAALRRGVPGGGLDTAEEADSHGLGAAADNLNPASSAPPERVLQGKLPLAEQNAGLTGVFPRNYGKDTYSRGNTAENTSGETHFSIELGDGNSSDGTTVPWTEFEIMGRLSSGYVLLETSGGYTVLDPAAACERVIYERMMASLADSKPCSQGLLMPHTVELKPLDADAVSKVLPQLRLMGFGIAPFGKSVFVVDAMPDAIREADCREVLIETAAAVNEAGRHKRDLWREQAAALAAGRAAAKLAGRMNNAELSDMIKALALCDMPYTRPSGGPTMIFTSNRDLDRRFGRIPERRTQRQETLS